MILFLLLMLKYGLCRTDLVDSFTSTGPITNTYHGLNTYNTGIDNYFSTSWDYFSGKSIVNIKFQLV